MNVDIIEAALDEDIGSGDLTSLFFVPEYCRSKARIFVKEPAVVAGTEEAVRVYQAIDSGLAIRVDLPDGSRADPGDTVITLSGSTRSILSGERVALNFIQRLSGVATLASKFVAAVKGTGAKILDTRKTTPGLRTCEKKAVVAGGAMNHRMGLYDGLIIKDNHLLARPELQSSILLVRERYPDILIEIEADSIEQVKDFVQLAGVNVILLDNMSLSELRACVGLRKPGLKFEASGGVSLQTVRQIAETGVDYVSVGQLTHSAPAIDFSLELLGE
ncbi:MAG: carboxylating nicotinate-nucleotide diphosphorylase [Verrucomicrobia bacterium]|nr:carboxylating nicotinate-nucleotide diphosphorylase [Verrucomicrobiota bacterium]